MMMNGLRHLSDDRLIEACLAEALPPSEQRHLQRCPKCTARHADLAALLDDVSAASRAAADEAFPPDRLARQQARILQRVAHVGGPARVLAFPRTLHESEPVSVRRPTTRWVAAAAAAGLVIGLAAGHLTRGFSVRPSPGMAAAPGTIRPAVPPFSEEEFMGQIELAIASPGGSALGTLNDLTPRAWEVK
jgi:hypothetical protein